MVYGELKTRERNLIILICSKSSITLESRFLKILDFLFSGWHYIVFLFFTYMDSSLKAPQRTTVYQFQGTWSAEIGSCADKVPSVSHTVECHPWWSSLSLLTAHGDHSALWVYLFLPFQSYFLLAFMCLFPTFTGHWGICLKEHDKDRCLFLPKLGSFVFISFFDLYSAISECKCRGFRVSVWVLLVPALL